ncbi:hypothetical protein PIB30_053387 [Stylosanthes scabra]|uniref:Uncharacterized protein n=1 Tax=Stylosanthes scabra TaxID=79078 RepID=A0ABU6SJ46_9FABA|nr:hypothetical protein [Stylosanthes scabra]
MKTFAKILARTGPLFEKPNRYSLMSIYGPKLPQLHLSSHLQMKRELRELIQELILNQFSTIHWRLRIAITFDPELRLMHRLRLHEACFVPFVSTPRDDLACIEHGNRSLCACNSELRLKSGMLGYSMVRRKSRVSIELGVQGAKGLRVLNLAFLRNEVELQEIDSLCNRKPNDHHLNRFWPFRVDSDDGPFLKKFSKCFESIWRKGTRESIRGLQNRFTSVQDLNLTFENYLRVDSSSSESILKVQAWKVGEASLLVCVV